ncbi:MAG: hypothetical protein ACI9JM_001453 [Halioglobus sp.]
MLAAAKPEFLFCPVTKRFASSTLISVAKNAKCRATFVTELDGTFVLEDLLAPGESVLASWSEVIRI